MTLDEEKYMRKKITLLEKIIEIYGNMITLSEGSIDYIEHKVETRYLLIELAALQKEGSQWK